MNTKLNKYIILMCVHTYSLKKRHSVGSHHNMIVVDKKEKTMINNEYKIKQIHNTNVC